jgi:hypothetical protein
MLMALMEPLFNMKKGVTWNTAPGIPTGVRVYSVTYVLLLSRFTKIAAALYCILAR